MQDDTWTSWWPIGSVDPCRSDSTTVPGRPSAIDATFPYGTVITSATEVSAAVEVCGPAVANTATSSSRSLPYRAGSNTTSLSCVIVLQRHHAPDAEDVLHGHSAATHESTGTSCAPPPRGPAASREAPATHRLHIVARGMQNANTPLWTNRGDSVLTFITHFGLAARSVCDSDHTPNLRDGIDGWIWRGDRSVYGKRCYRYPTIGARNGSVIHWRVFC